MYPVSIKGVLMYPPGHVVLALNERDEWELPGGRIELLETPEACLGREFKEELRLDVHAEAILDAYLFEVIPGRRVFIVTYGCVLIGPYDPGISEEHEAIGVFDMTALPSNLPDGYRRSIEAWNALVEQRQTIEANAADRRKATHAS